MLLVQEKPVTHARCYRKAGLLHLIFRSKLDTIWLVAGPVHKLLTIFYPCPCRCLWRFLPEISEDINRKIIFMPGVSMQVWEFWFGFGICVMKGCFFDAIQPEYSRPMIRSACCGCCCCVDVCPNHAIELIIANSWSIREMIHRISPLVGLK